MPHIIPIRDLKNTGDISLLCHETTEPIYVTKNGYGDMVIMSMKTYEEKLYMQEIREKLAAAEAQFADGKSLDARQSLRDIRAKYNV